MGSLHEEERRPAVKSAFPRGEGGAFWLGVTLMAVSFGVYPAYLAIALIPAPIRIRIAAAALASITSWALFFLGSLIAGKRGVSYVRRWFARDRGEPPAPPL
jgi:hypothetical protein